MQNDDDGGVVSGNPGRLPAQQGVRSRPRHELVTLRAHGDLTRRRRRRFERVFVHGIAGCSIHKQRSTL